MSVSQNRNLLFIQNAVDVAREFFPASEQKHNTYKLVLNDYLNTPENLVKLAVSFAKLEFSSAHPRKHDKFSAKVNEIWDDVQARFDTMLPPLIDFSNDDVEISEGNVPRNVYIDGILYHWLDVLTYNSKVLSRLMSQYNKENPENQLKRHHGHKPSILNHIWNIGNQKEIQAEYNKIH